MGAGLAPPNTDRASCKLDPHLNVTDYFTPVAHASETNSDKDLGSGGVLLLPDNTGAHPHEAINCSKLTIIYVLDRDNMGRLSTGDTNVVQQVNNQLGGIRPARKQRTSVSIRRHSGTTTCTSSVTTTS